MDPASIARLVLLSAIWGASFLFIRVGAPGLGPSLLIFFRVGLAALFLLAVALHLKQTLDARRHWRHYLMLGLFNSALPFLLFAYASQTVSASLLSILNAAAPIWAAAIAASWTRTRLAPRPLMGLLLGIDGVALLPGVETLTLPAGGGAAILAALGAAFCYGFMSTYARSATAIEPFANAASIGDDAIQEMSQGSVQPESWTHGSSEQRQFWLRRGVSTGDPNRCDTFKETRP